MLRAFAEGILKAERRHVRASGQNGERKVLTRRRGLVEAGMRARIWKLLLALAATCYLSNAWAIFVNGDFETGNFSGWTTSVALNNLGGLKLPQPFTEASLNLGSGGTQLLSVVGAVSDPRTDNILPLPGSGKFTAKINDETGSYHANVISQQAAITNADRGTDGKLHVRFSYAAVLEDPSHQPEEQPFFYVHLKDVTNGQVLYFEFTYSNQPSRSFHTSNYGSSVWKWTDWNNIDIVVPESSLGHTLEITAAAADCSLGGHGGYVYLDGFGSQTTIPTNYTVTGLRPSSAKVGGPAFTLTVDGTGFLSSDVIQWNGFSRATTYVSPTQLQASIPASDLATAGTANVTVARGTTSSNTLPFTIAAQAAIPASERAVLTNLYSSTNGASWTSHTNWNGGVGTECTWYGVTCDATQNHVTRIDLPGNNLVGSLPLLSGLTALQVFRVPTNQLTGPVPAPPSSLLAGQSGLCSNSLVSSGNAAIDAAWVTAQNPLAVIGGNWLACQTGGGGAVPACTLTATPASIAAGGTSTLAVRCSPAAAFYTWSANAGFGRTVTTGTVSPAATTTYTVAGGNAGGTGNTASATVTVTAGWPGLSVTKLGTGSGTVTSSVGINCGATCGANFPGGTKVTLTATPAVGSTFAGWIGACTGTGTCTVTMNTSNEVTATFNLVPFAVATTKVITPTIATITTRITFNAPDLGKTGAVYVTAWVPVGALGALGITVTADSQVSVTSTTDNPSLAGAGNTLHVTQEMLAELDSSAFVLVQLTSTGWQPVTNGQLIPYAAGVLGDILATQTILNNTDSTNLAGAQFCLGYGTGTSATDMIVAGNVQLIATVPNSTPTGSATGSCLMTQLPVYRFVNVNTGGHYFTISDTERSAAQKNGVYKDEGIGFNAYPTQQSGTLPVYRFYNTTGQGYFYTIYESEKNNVIQNNKGFTYQGIAFFAYPTQQADTLPLYRFQNTRASAHFFTIYESEKDTVIQNYNWFLYEGASFYVYLRQSLN